MSVKLKKGIKKIVSLAVSAAILGTGFPLDGFNIGASAADQLSSTIEYDVDGYPILIIEASEENYSIRYTVDGSVPSINSLVYDYPVAFSKETVVRVAEFDENGNRISGIKRTLTPKTAPISFFVEQDYDLGKAYVTIECRTVGSDTVQNRRKNLRYILNLLNLRRILNFEQELIVMDIIQQQHICEM